MLKKTYALLIGIIVQIYILQYSYHEYFVGEVNSLLLYNVYGIGISYQLLYQAYSYFFFGIISFIFMGKMRKNTEYYGILYLYRGKSNLIFLYSQVLKIIFGVFMIMILETLAFTVYNWIKNTGLKIIITQTEIESYILWILTFISLIMLQMTLELFMDDTVAVLIVNIYVLLGISLGNILLERGSSILYIFIHNYSMYLRSDEVFSKSPLTFSYELVILFIIIIGCFCTSLIRLKKKDYLE